MPFALFADRVQTHRGDGVIHERPAPLITSHTGCMKVNTSADGRAEWQERKSYLSVQELCEEAHTFVELFVCKLHGSCHAVLRAMNGWERGEAEGKSGG